VKLQNDLSQLVGWSERWQLGFNKKKCKLFHLGNSNRKYTYEMNDTTINITHAEKDIGVTLDEDLKFKKHVANAGNYRFITFIILPELATI